MKKLNLSDPTQNISLDFAAYVNRRQTQLAAHMVGGVPDYAFSLDAQIRSKLASIGLLRAIGQALNSATVPFQRQKYQMEGIAVGPKQFPEVHAMGEDCARILGIGVPQMFITYNPFPNAFTFCTNDVDQLVILTSGLVEACQPQELLSVIGHECGHIHNQHVVYNTIWEILVNPTAEAMVLAIAQVVPGLRSVIALIQLAARLSLRHLMLRWHRCAEFTCDRAGLICCGNLSAALGAEGKLHAGSAQSLAGFNPEEYGRQIEQINASPMKFLEIFQTHPFGPKRVQAMQLFSECEVLFAWRPDMRTTQPPLSKAEVDKACVALVM